MVEDDEGNFTSVCAEDNLAAASPQDSGRLPPQALLCPLDALYWAVNVCTCVLTALAGWRGGFPVPWASAEADSIGKK